MSSSRIRDLRRAEGWTQERLASSSGVAVRTIQRIEAGDEGSLETLTALARTLGVPVKDISSTSGDAPDRHRYRGDLDEAEPHRRPQPPAAAAQHDGSQTRTDGRGHRAARASLRSQWTIGIIVTGLVVGTLISFLLGPAYARPATGTVRVEIGAGNSQRLVDVALIDAGGQEYVGNNSGAGGSQELEAIPTGRVQVNVGACTVPATVLPDRTTTVRFDPGDCIN